MKVEKFLTQEELEKTQALHNDFNKLKMQLGDTELQKQGILKQIDMLKNFFAEA